MFDLFVFVFFFKQKTAYEMRISDWSSDVCSSDLKGEVGRAAIIRGRRLRFRLAAHVAAEAVPRRAGIDRRRRLREDRLALVPLTFPSDRTAICHLRRLREVDRANRPGQRAAIGAAIGTPRARLTGPRASRRSDERRVGNDRVSKCPHRWLPSHSKKKKKI